MPEMGSFDWLAFIYYYVEWLTREFVIELVSNPNEELQVYDL